MRSNAKKLVTALIKPFKLEDMRENLSKIGVQGITITESKSFVRQSGHTEHYLGDEYAADLLSNVKIETAISDRLLEQTIEVITSDTNAGGIGDGKISVTDLVQIIRIRTDETGEDAV
tara:strand:- start:1343 stop:1696 length:354 start_codon:yes stop_codon:yes gene_type:complete